MAGHYGLDSAEAVAKLEWLPAPADREANTRYHKMQKMDDGTEAEVVVRTQKNRNSIVFNPRQRG